MRKHNRTWTEGSIDQVSVASKVLEKLVNNTIVDHLEKCGLFLQLYLMELLGILTRLGLLEL